MYDFEGDLFLVGADLHGGQGGAGPLALAHHRPRVHGGAEVHVAGAVHGVHLERVQPDAEPVQDELVHHHVLHGRPVQHVAVRARQLVAPKHKVRGARVQRLPGRVRLEEGVGRAHVHHKVALRLVAN
eukprot:299784-Prorocentrum_minimum.AAC.5